MIRSAKPKRDTRKPKPDTPEEIANRAWGAGWDACLAGVPREDNPYDPVEQPEASSEWFTGFDEANR